MVRAQGTAESTAGNLSGRWLGQPGEQVRSTRAKDGEIFCFLSADWDDITPLDPPPFKNIQVRASIMDNLLQCSAILVLRGSQCGPLHLDLVVHVKNWLWTITPPERSVRDVEGFGRVDYLNILWTIDSRFALYRTVTTAHGLANMPVGEFGTWDAYWYIYRRGDQTPSYSHVGVDTSATLNKQKHVAELVKLAVEYSYTLERSITDLSASNSSRNSGRRNSGNSIVGSLRGRFRSGSQR